MLTVRGKKVDYKNMTLVDIAEGNSMDVYFTLKIFYILYEELKKIELIDFYENLIVPLTPIFAEIESKGMKIASDKLYIIGKGLELNIAEELKKITELQEVQEVVKEGKTNLNSPKILCDILFTSDKGYNLYPPVWTDGGDPSSNEKCLSMLLEQIEEELESRGKQ